MNFVPSIAITGAPARGRRPQLPVPPDGLLPRDIASFDTLDGWTLDPGWSASGGAVSHTPGSVSEFVTRDLAIPSGDVWVAYTVRDASAGAVSVQLLDAFANSPFANRVSAHQVARFASVGHTRFRLNGTATFDGTVSDIQPVDMTQLLAQPTDIYIAAGQSLMASEASSIPPDPDKDHWVPRCLYLPGASVSTYGTQADQVAACAAPLQMSTISQGVSPALHFARAVERATPQGRTVTILACAQSGTRLVGDDAEWNPAGNVGAGGTRYAAMRDRALAAVAATAGNAVKGLIWAQGESDRAADMDTTYPPAFAAMLAQLRSDLGQPALPAIILGPMPDDATATQPLFIETQERLDQDSGHATAIAGVHYVARQSGFLSADGTHPEPEGNRLAGKAAGQRFIAEGYL